MGKKKKKRQTRERSALAERVLTFTLDTLAALLAGLATAAILRLVGW